MPTRPCQTRSQGSRPPWHSPWAGWATQRGALIIGAGAVVALLVAVLLVQRAAPPPDRPWLLALCDVGQGDGIVVATSPGHALVVDVGPDSAAMDRCLDELHVEVIDALLITHLHDDHYGGVAGAVEGREVGALYYSTGEEGLPSAVTDAAADAGVDPQQLTLGTALDLPPLRIDVLWPSPAAPPGEENNASAVLEVVLPAEPRPITLLLTGDLEEDAAAQVLSAVPHLSGGIDILKIAHHGARNGGETMIGVVRPALAVVSVGRDNEYGHPHPSILEALAAADVTTARTDELGSFTVGVEGDALAVRPFG